MTTNLKRIEKLPTNRFRNRRQHWIYGKFRLMEILVLNYDAIRNMSNFVKETEARMKFGRVTIEDHRKILPWEKGSVFWLNADIVRLIVSAGGGWWGLRVKRARQSLFIKYEIIWVIVCHSCLVFVFACHRIITGRF